MEKIEMHPAWVWDCPECGRENFARSIVVEMSEEESLELKLQSGINEWGDGFWQTAPSHVECKHCKFGFEAEHDLEIWGN